jgi:hypothetical protein
MMESYPAKPLQYKYNEEELIKQLLQYVNSTYGQHYAQGDIQTTEFIISNGDGIAFTRGNVIKYAQRYGKKEGRSRKDIMKILHYALIMLYTHDLETQQEKLDYENLARNNQHPQEFRYDQLESSLSGRPEYCNDLDSQISIRSGISRGDLSA